MICLDDTWDKKDIHGPVCFPHPGDGSGKKNCPNKLCFHQRGIQPKIEVIFWGTGSSIADHHTKEDGPKEELLILQDNPDDQVQKNTKICVSRYTTPFFGITIMSKHMTWILLNQVQEIRSGFGL